MMLSFKTLKLLKFPAYILSPKGTFLLVYGQMELTHMQLIYERFSIF